MKNSYIIHSYLCSCDIIYLHAGSKLFTFCWTCFVLKNINATSPCLESSWSEVDSNNSIFTKHFSQYCPLCFPSQEHFPHMQFPFPLHTTSLPGFTQVPCGGDAGDMWICNPLDFSFPPNDVWYHLVLWTVTCTSLEFWLALAFPTNTGTMIGADFSVGFFTAKIVTLAESATIFLLIES